ncbi:hypothetical protein J2W92_004726 [Rhizobium leguminosarum]
MSVWKGKALVVYYLTVSMAAFLGVRTIYSAATHINIDGPFAHCGVSYLTSGVLWLSMATFSVLMHMVVGYLYYSRNGEGPYGPLAVAQRGKAPPRTRIVPYVANFAVIVSIVFAGGMSFPTCQLQTDHLSNSAMRSTRYDGASVGSVLINEGLAVPLFAAKRAARRRRDRRVGDNPWPRADLFAF